MTREEIIQKLEAGETLKMTFGIRNNYYNIGEEKITERQFNSMVKLYGDKLDFVNDFGGFTKHKYTLKKS